MTREAQSCLLTPLLMNNIPTIVAPEASPQRPPRLPQLSTYLRFSRDLEVAGLRHELGGDVAGGYWDEAAGHYDQHLAPLLAPLPVPVREQSPTRPASAPASPPSGPPPLVQTQQQLLDLNADVQLRLVGDYYRHYNWNWEELMEISLFGGLLREMFLLDAHMWHYVLGYPTAEEWSSEAGFVNGYREFVLLVAVFKQENSNAEFLQLRSSDWQVLERAGRVDGQRLAFPLAVVLLQNWSAQYGGASDSPLVPMYYAARTGYIVRTLHSRGFFTEVAPAGNGALLEEAMLVNRFTTKDNQLALALAATAIANHHQQERWYNCSIHYFETAGHLTLDIDCIRTALLGLTAGMGYGNVKENKGNGSTPGAEGRVNALHPRQRLRQKSENKRRVAQLYRQMERLLGVQEFGLLWVWKDKYNV